MKFSKIASTLLLLVGATSAAAIPEVQAHSALDERAGFQILNKVQVFTSNNNNRYQVRLLGPARLVEGVRAAFGVTKLGSVLAKSFFENFLQATGLGASNEVYQDKYALYKDSDTVGGGILGFQFEITSDFPGLPAQPGDLTAALDIIRRYFNDNRIKPLEEKVSNAFNIGGPWQMAPQKREAEGVVKRDVCPVAFDFVSMFAADTVTWNPDSPIFATKMCTEFPSGPGKH